MNTAGRVSIDLRHRLGMRFIIVNDENVNRNRGEVLSISVEGSHEAPSHVGSEIVKRVPFPGSLSQDIVPSCASTIFRTVGNPNPLPPDFVE